MRLSNIAIYDKSTIDFYNQGLGILSDAISSESTEAVQDNGNITYEMTLKYPINGVLADKLKLPNLIRAQESEDPNDFMIFEIYDYDEDDDGEMTVYAQALPYRVLRLPFNDEAKFATKYNDVQELFDDAIKRVTGFPTWFKINSDVKLASNLNFKDSQFENLGKLLEATMSLIDATVEYQWNQINILQSRGRDLTNIVLRDDKNTNGVKITGSYEKIINKVVPIIRNRDDKTGEFVEGSHMGEVVTSKDPFKWIPYYAGVTANFDSQEEANNYISSNKLDNPAITATVTPLMVDEDLTQVHAFDKITAYSTKLKYQDSLQVTTRVFDQLNAEVVSFTMGAIKKDVNGTTTYSLSSLASEIAAARHVANGALKSANGKNTNNYQEETPENPIEGDLWLHKIDGKDVIQQYINGEWSTIIKDGMGKEIRSYVDQKMLENDGVMDKLHTDLASNAQIIKDNKQAVDNAMIKVNEDLTKAKSDAESAVQKADDAVTNAQSAVKASGLATTTANAANDAATAAKDLATDVSNNFATVQSQAATAASDASTALDQAKSALDTANGVSDNYKSIKQTVDDTSGTIKTLATSASVDALSGRVTKAQSLAEETADGLTFKANSSTVDTLSNTVKQQGIDLKAAQGELALKLTQSDLAKGLDGYATQTWAQNQINATANSWSTQLNSLSAKYDSSLFVNRNLVLNSHAPTTLVPWHAVLWAADRGELIATNHGFWKNGTETLFREHVTAVGLTAGGYCIASGRMEVKPNTTYTIQLKGFAPSNSGGITVYFLGQPYDYGTGDAYKNVHNLVSNQKMSFSYVQPFSWTFTTADDDNTGYIRIDVSQSTDGADTDIYWTEVEMSEGANTPVYSPAPEDSATYTDQKSAELSVTLDQYNQKLIKVKTTADTATDNLQEVTNTANSTSSLLATVQNTVSNIRSAGANLVYNSNAELGLDGWDANNPNAFGLGTHPYWYNGTKNFFRLNPSGTGTNDETYMVSKTITVKPNTVYHLHFFWIATFNVSGIDVYFLNASNGMLSSGWKPTSDHGVYDKDFNSGSNTSMQIRVDINGSTNADMNAFIGIAEICLSEGIGSVPWSAASADSAKVTAFNSVKSTVDGTVQSIGNINGQLTTINKSISGIQNTVAGKASTSQFTQLDDQLTSVVGGLSNPNLIVNSGAPTQTSPWQIVSWSSPRGSLGLIAHNFWKNGTEKIFCLNNNAGTGRDGVSVMSNYFPVKPSTDYTIQLDGFAPSNLVGITVYLLAMPDGYKNNQDEYKNVHLAASNQKLSPSMSQHFVWHVKTSADDTTAYLRIDTCGTTDGKSSYAAFTDVKVEQGTLATPWADSVSNSQITQLQGLIDQRVIVDGKITAALSLSADGGGTVTIRGASLYVTAASHFDNASIQSAAIASLDATKITSGSISSDRLATTKLNANNITSGSISADRLATTKLNASNITTGSMNASLITAGSLNADRISGGTFNGDNMNVININGHSITAGTITADKLAANAILVGINNGLRKLRIDSNGLYLHGNSSDIGYISSSNPAIDTSLNGLAFNLSSTADYMSWAAQNRGDANGKYQGKLTWARADVAKRLNIASGFTFDDDALFMGGMTVVGQSVFASATQFASPVMFASEIADTDNVRGRFGHVNISGTNCFGLFDSTGKSGIAMSSSNLYFVRGGKAYSLASLHTLA